MIPQGDSASLRTGLAIRLFRLALLAAVLGTAYFAFTPVAHAGVDQVWDKLKHTGAFFILALLLDRSVHGSRFGAKQVLVLIGWGGVIEIVQYFLPYREASLADLFADAIGVFAYMLAAALSARIPCLKGRSQDARPP